MYSYTKGAKAADFQENYPLLGSACVGLDITRYDDNGDAESGLLLEFESSLLTASNMRELAAWIAVTEFFDTAEQWITFRDKNGEYDKGLS